MSPAAAAELQDRIEAQYALPAEALGDEAHALFQRFLQALEHGEVRAAEPGADGWKVNGWVKKGILLGFRLGKVVATEEAGPLRFFDKDTLPARKLTLADGVRVVPGGTAVRSGAYVAPGVVVMPPAYVNVGAWVGEGTMVDSHALVGSCAQVGRRVHLSAGAMLGGVLEPVGALPVVVEDEVLVGGNCGVYEGTIVGRRAVLGSGVILTGSVTVYDVPRRTSYRRTATAPLRIPEGAVVVPGARALAGAFAEKSGLGLYTPVIVKYRDEKTDGATALEEALR
ncbi:MAG TPA: 2,3,4,5-tetrahydropyridine-2,6-dicarboxylate N-succinyltransferase [Vicinamibacteria bacterium]|nr:2,3,4,5-tetrahydropyridine-2,6-dicarboxylate N-succinyltransferase [Vicinamibacteria bacterium]